MSKKSTEMSINYDSQDRFDKISKGNWRRMKGYKPTIGKLVACEKLPRKRPRTWKEDIRPNLHGKIMRGLFHFSINDKAFPSVMSTAPKYVVIIHD